MTWVEVVNQGWTILQRVGWVEILDVAVVTVIIYQILKLFRGTRAIQLLVGVMLLIVVGLVAVALHLLLLSWLFVNAAPFVVIAVIVLFQPEMRRALDQMGRLGHLGRPLSAFSPSLFSRAVMEAIRATERLSARKTGALVAFERDVGLEDYAATGVRINGELSAEFLQQIFYPNSPLHDGAVIIRGSHILAAGCLLPLPEEGTIRERLGTRHRAAVGLSLASDALVLVVSEETGAISLVENGTIVRNLDADGLRKRLTGSLPTVKPNGGRPLLSWLK
ncbi:MAG: diadenylate cyclase CdaA [Candidatus Dormibacteraceae bacterium]